MSVLSTLFKFGRLASIILGWNAKGPSLVWDDKSRMVAVPLEKVQRPPHDAAWRDGGDRALPLEFVSVCQIADC